MTTDERIAEIEKRLKIVEERLGLQALILQVQAADLSDYKNSEPIEEATVWQNA